MATYGPIDTSAPAGAIIVRPGDNVASIVNSAPQGATFYFEAGVYSHFSVDAKAGQTFIGAKGAVLSGADQLTGFTQEGSHWVIGGQTQQGPRYQTEHGDGSISRVGYPETVFVDDKPLTPVDSLAKLTSGTFYFDYAADKIYLADNPAGHTVEAGKATYAIGGSANNVTVQNFLIEKYNAPIQHGAIEGNQGWTIVDNEVRLTYGVGIVARDGSKILGNYSHDNGEMGLGGSGNNILVEGNEIASNGKWSGIDVFWEGGGFKFAYTDGLVVRGNYSHDNKGFGMWTDIDNINTLYENNLVTHNSGGGITHEISYDAVIRNNVLTGNGFTSQGDADGDTWMWGGQIQLQNSQNVELYGNRIDMTGAQGGNAIGLIQQNRGSGAYGQYLTTDNYIHDNTIVSADGSGKVGAAADWNQQAMLSGNNVWANNTYHMPDGGRFWWGGTTDFQGFKAATGESGTLSQAYPDVTAWLDDTGLLPSDSGTVPGGTGGPLPDYAGGDPGTEGTTGGPLPTYTGADPTGGSGGDTATGGTGSTGGADNTGGHGGNGGSGGTGANGGTTGTPGTTDGVIVTGGSAVDDPRGGTPTTESPGTTGGDAGGGTDVVTAVDPGNGGNGSCGSGRGFERWGGHHHPAEGEAAIDAASAGRADTPAEFISRLVAEMHNHEAWAQLEAKLAELTGGAAQTPATQIASQAAAESAAPADVGAAAADAAHLADFTLAHSHQDHHHNGMLG